MCNEILNTNEYKQFIYYRKETGYKPCRCEFKNILKRQEEYEKEKKATEEYNKKLEAMDKDVIFLHSLEKKSFFQNLKEKFSKKYCGEVNFYFEVLNFKRNLKKS